jgi:hypothetical protein
VTLVRESFYPGKLIVIDGISGTGKTLLNGLIALFGNSHLPFFSYIVEQLCITNHLKFLDDEAAQILLKLQIDQKRYDHQIGREVNVRPRDLSSLLRSSKKTEYLNYFFAKDGAYAESMIYKKPANLIIVTHQLLHASSILDNIYGDSMVRIHAMRHPAYLYDHWLSCIGLIARSLRDFTPWVKINGETSPWFLHDELKLKSFQNLSDNDKAAICVIKLSENAISFHNTFRLKPNYLAFNFENFVLNPSEYLAKSSHVLGAYNPRRITNYLSREKVPRVHINSGKTRKIYQRYGSKNLNSQNNQRIDYEQKLDLIKKVVSRELQNRYLEVINDYENEFGLWFE